VKSGYFTADRLLHRLALGNLALQKSLADIEDHLHASRLEQIPVDRPVFVTSLPRAGTTLLLEVINETGAFASHTYRDMPFVLCPLLWDAISRGLRRKVQARERAHGDGMMVGCDSVEAFEEVLWKAFWPQRYFPDRILTWSSHDRDPEFEQAFTNHIRKVIAVRGASSRRILRYLSKNNANISRLRLLAELFPIARSSSRFGTLLTTRALSRDSTPTFWRAMRRIDSPEPTWNGSATTNSGRRSARSRSLAKEPAQWRNPDVGWTTGTALSGTYWTMHQSKSPSSITTNSAPVRATSSGGSLTPSRCRTTGFCTRHSVCAPRIVTEAPRIRVCGGERKKPIRCCAAEPCWATRRRPSRKLR